MNGMPSTAWPKCLWFRANKCSMIAFGHSMSVQSLHIFGLVPGNVGTSTVAIPDFWYLPHMKCCLLNIHLSYFSPCGCFIGHPVWICLLLGCSVPFGGAVCLLDVSEIL